MATESFDKLPEATVRAARRAILDTLGVMLAGSVEVTAARVHAVVAHRRGRGEATIVGTPYRASIEDAALANGTAAHALDYDGADQRLREIGEDLEVGTLCALGCSRRCADLRIVFRYDTEYGMSWRFGRESIEARFGHDIEEWPRDRHLDHVAFQDRRCLDRFHIEENDAFALPPASQGHLSGSPGISNPGNLPIRGH